MCERPKLDGILSYAPDDIQSYVSDVFMLWLLYMEFYDAIGEGDGDPTFSDYFSLILELVNESTTLEKLLFFLFRGNFTVVHVCHHS